MFQFHNGSIKSRFAPGLRYQLRSFQFHNGSIKRGDNQSVVSPELEKFQFHNGSIKSCRMRHKTDFIFVVSIPQWFD